MTDHIVALTFCVPQTLPSLEQLVEEAKKTLLASEILQRFLSKGISDCFLKASMWQLNELAGSAQFSSEMKQQRDAVLRRTSYGDSQEVSSMHIVT